MYPAGRLRTQPFRLRPRNDALKAKYMTKTYNIKIQHSGYDINLSKYISYHQFILKKLFYIQSTLALQTPCIYGHPIIWTAAKSLAQINYRCLTEVNYRDNNLWSQGCPQQRELTVHVFYFIFLPYFTNTKGEETLKRNHEVY